jgi:hypothetical protein
MIIHSRGRIQRVTKFRFGLGIDGYYYIKSLGESNVKSNLVDPPSLFKTLNLNK